MKVIKVIVVKGENFEKVVKEAQNHFFDFLTQYTKEKEVS